MSLVASPNVWAMAVSWLVAAVVGSLLCARGNRGLAACGMLAATTILVLGAIAATRLGGADFPDVAQLAPALVAGIAMTCATAAGVPRKARPNRIAGCLSLTGRASRSERAAV